MAQSATSTAKTSTAVRRPERSVRIAAGASASQRSVPLDLAPLIAPYRAQHRMTLRIERMPSQARLSRGRNNGDNTWSLGTDEIEGLAFIPPENFDEPHRLAVRIVSLEDAATIIVIDYAVSPHDLASDEVTSNDAQPKVAAPSNDAKLNRIEDELERVRAALTAHESVLAETLHKAGQAALGASQHAIERELARARADWDAERDHQLAEAANFAKAELERRRDAWQAEQDAHLVKLEEAARTELAEARTRWQAETEAALVKAERIFRAGEAQRLAAAEAHWKEQFGTKPAVARANAEEIAARERAESDLRRAQAALSEAESALSERDASLAQTRSEAQRESDRLRLERDAAIRAAERAWKAEEAKRLAQAEANWHQESESALAEMTERLERADASLAQARADVSSQAGQAQIDAENARDRAERELRSLKTQFAAMEKLLADRNAEIAKARAEGEETQDRLIRESDDALAKAEETWKVQEAARLAAARGAWRREAERLTEEARAEGQQTREQSSVALMQLREDFAVLQASLAERDAELARARAESEDALTSLRLRSDEALRQAERAWKAEETARLSGAKAQWNDQMTFALAEATTRYQQAETALAQQRARHEAELRSGNDGDADHLNREIAVLQAALATCERELAQLRSALGETAPDGTLDAQAILEPRSIRPLSDRRDDEEGEEESAGRRALVRDVLVIAALVVAAILALPLIESYLPDEWQEQISAITGSAPTPAKVESTPAPVLPPVPALHMELVVHSARLRESPSAAAPVISTLKDGAAVAVLDQQGDWSHVSVDPRSAKPTQGWVISSRLKDEPDDGQSAPAAAANP